MTRALSAVLYAIVLATAFAATPPPVPGSVAPARRAYATRVALLVVGLPTLAQLTVAPWLLRLLERKWDQILSGQVWRLVTSLVVQDGGLPGAAFNILSLAVFGTAAEAAWGSRRWLALALGAGVGAQFWGAVVQPVGGGNSVVVFGLAASLAVLGLVDGAGVHRVLGAASLFTSGVLLLVGDIHGGAAATGAATAATLIRCTPRPDASR